MEKYEREDVLKWISSVLKLDMVKQLKSAVTIDTQGSASESALIQAGVPEQYIKDALPLLGFLPPPHYDNTRALVFGRPGSGKSTAIEHMMKRLSTHGYHTRQISDYDLLYEMFQSGHPGLRPTDRGDFEIIDFSILNHVLYEIENRTSKQLLLSGEFISIELARFDCHRALRHFSPNFLNSSYFLCINASPDICKRRTDRKDNTFSTQMLQMADNQSRPTDGVLSLFDDLGIRHDRMRVAENLGPLSMFLEQIDAFLQDMSHSYSL